MMIDQALPHLDRGFGARRSAAVRDYVTMPTQAPREGAVWSLSCHYCGFEPDARETPLTRCPKCGGSAWELTPVPGSLLTHAQRTAADARPRAALADDEEEEINNDHEGEEDGDARALGNVLFRVRCAATQVYLLFGPDPGRARMLPLHQANDNEWETRLHLPPGVYRYRFYVDDGKRLVYFATSDVTGTPSRRLDGRLLVPKLQRA